MWLLSTPFGLECDLRALMMMSSLVQNKKADDEKTNVLLQESMSVFRADLRSALLPEVVHIYVLPSFMVAMNAASVATWEAAASL